MASWDLAASSPPEHKGVKGNKEEETETLGTLGLGCLCWDHV